ncbi:MAG: CDP-diacylglycerol--glycerol-3-phosphate 3-phosphatidyltransferase [Nitrospinota bacterium]|nr:CDP-diacylglycerol--glycerol-3-phosphate 3-phosphatidyltransferase [Nitrospinota bacterium]MDH5679128.1 CDP-diacylglycerol--glycerol-3-phosphate 3-phosphatidyltransferase [Nitrospinota bacterium]MDH5756939.1 CDP-diacylglycerol--glycerol-3-phosphate 3-phosphatidyltransferase [Nitrospinota bacterium]
MLTLNLPNKITLFRIFMVPLLIVFLISPSKLSCILAAMVFALAAATDWLDGHLARVTNQVTILGKLLDPIADKLLVLSALVPLVELDRVAAWIVVVILGREFAVSGLRMIASSQGIHIAAGQLGKYKMFAEILAIFTLILDFVPLFNFIGQTGILVAMGLSVISGVGYFAQFWGQVDPDKILWV